jgi:hypothetical protein
MSSWKTIGTGVVGGAPAWRAWARRASPNGGEAPSCRDGVRGAGAVVALIEDHQAKAVAKVVHAGWPVVGGGDGEISSS